jgi:hypothetical protein
MNRGFWLFIAAVMMAGIAVPAACAAEQDVPYRIDASRTVLQVQTDDAILGRITYVDAGGAYITRQMNVIPATVGETLLPGDMVSVQPGKFANLKLVDQPDETMLGGGTDGTVVVIERYYGIAEDGSSGQVAEDLLPEPVMATLSSIGSVVEDILTSVRELIAGESFKAHEDTAVPVFADRHPTPPLLYTISG